MRHEHLADRIAILHQGRIIENGTLAELAAPSAREGRIRREAADPWGRLPCHRRQQGDAEMVGASTQMNEEQR